MYIVQGEWIVKRRNCAATLNNRGSEKEKSRTYVRLFVFWTLSAERFFMPTLRIYGEDSCV
jgi:hypothetical protein